MSSKSLQILYVLTLFVPASASTGGADLRITERDGQVILQLDEQTPFHVTNRAVQNARLVYVEGSEALMVIWEERDAARGVVPMFAIFPDGVTVARVTETDYQLQLRFQRFDPALGEPQIVEAFKARPDAELFTIQFYGQVLPQFTAPLAARGVALLRFLPNSAFIAKMEASAVQEVSGLSFVRSVRPFHPGYRVDERLIPELVQANDAAQSIRYSAQLVDGSSATLEIATQVLANVGATLLQTIAATARLEFQANGSQLLEFLQTDEVLFVDRPGEPGLDMDRVRDFGGANHIEPFGFTGQGVRGEVMDYGVRITHVGFQTPAPPMVHGMYVPYRNTWRHGTNVYGIIFGDQTSYSCDAEGACGRGILPDAQGIFATWLPFYDVLPNGNRYNHTSQLVRSNDCGTDPLCPYNAVFQTNSWGQEPRLEFTIFSAEMDQIVFDLDLFICQSQTNCGRAGAYCENSPCAGNPRCSRPEAWSKNVVSIGAIFDFPNDDHRNDVWCPAGSGTDPISCGNPLCGSRGPAIDGRVKPDLVNFGDCIRTADSWYYHDGDTDYRPEFGATSAATPSTCGYAGLVFQMWHESVFKVWNGSASMPTGTPNGTVFSDRPHAATVKAMLINTAYRYPLVTEPPLYRPDFTRDNMGWGIVDVAALYEQRDNMFIVNETDLLTLFGTHSYTYTVPTGSPALRVTMVYADPPGIPNSSFNLVNDLSLKVTSPSGVVYWGNWGLVACPICADYYEIPFVGNWSLIDPEPALPKKDHVNNVENVFVKNPQTGTWTITVIADAINQDGHVETGALDADYALVVSSGDRPRGRCCETDCDPEYHCTCSWTSRSECTSAGWVWTSDATCADDCTNVCPNFCAE